MEKYQIEVEDQVSKPLLRQKCHHGSKELDLNMVNKEAEVKEENKEFMEGKIDWFERINEYSDLPEDEFVAERTGDFDSDKKRYGRGLIHPEVAPVDEASERYFDTFRHSRAAAPASYSSVDKGYVTEVK